MKNINFSRISLALIFALLLAAAGGCLFKDRAKVSGHEMQKSQDVLVKTENTAIDLSGTWQAFVKDDTGKWDYTMVLTSESSDKWTGNLTITLNGSSPSTTDVSIESVGGGKIRYTWRAGGANAEEFEGTCTQSKINVSGYGGQIVYTRKQ